MGEKIPRVVMMTFILIHFFSLTVSIAMSLVQQFSLQRSLLFAVAFCSGILIFGIISRKDFQLLFKIYFGIYILSVPVFVFSPSTLISIISMGELHKNHDNKIDLGDGLFLEQQQAMINKASSKDLTYKVIKRLGYFNKTIALQQVLFQ